MKIYLWVGIASVAFASGAFLSHLYYDAEMSKRATAQAEANETAVQEAVARAGERARHSDQITRQALQDVELLNQFNSDLEEEINVVSLTPEDGLRVGTPRDPSLSDPFGVDFLRLHRAATSPGSGSLQPDAGGLPEPRGEVADEPP